jgi:N-acetylglucosamine-6-phosphate deacetylase
MATHIFNAMEGLGSREPGTVGAILANDNLKTGLIADGIHVHPMSMKIVVKAKGNENVFLVTDAMPPVGTNLASFKLYDKTIYVKEGGCYAADGTLAGSALTMNVAVKNIHQQVGIPLNYAIAMATEVPAKAIGLSDKKGSLAVGKDADIVICDSGMRILKVLVGGRIVYEAQ